MHLFWARSDRFLLVLLAIVVASVGVLATLVMHQQYDQSTVDGQVDLRTAVTVPAASVPAGADIMATPNAATHPNPATTPNPAHAPVEPASQPAPAFPAPQTALAPPMAATPLTSALAASVPQIITPAQLAPSPQTPLKRKTVLHRRVNSVPAPPPAAAAHPVTPAPQTDTPAKPGSPDGW